MSSYESDSDSEDCLEKEISSPDIEADYNQFGYNQTALNS